eukprot:CFRG0705T1
MCGAVWCKETAKKENRAVHVPKKIELRRKWLENIRPDYKENDLTRELRVCHRHFKPEQFHTINKYTKVKKGELPMTFEQECAYYGITDEEMRRKYSKGGKKRARVDDESSLLGSTNSSALVALSTIAMTNGLSGANEMAFRGVLEEKNARINALLAETGQHSELNTTLRIENERLRSAMRQIQTLIRQVIKDPVPTTPTAPRNTTRSMSSNAITSLAAIGASPVETQTAPQTHANPLPIPSFCTDLAPAPAHPTNSQARSVSQLSIDSTTAAAPAAGVLPS